MKPKELAALLIARGWIKVRQRGSHHVFKHEGRPDSVVVPWADTNRNINAGLAAHILSKIERGDLLMTHQVRPPKTPVIVTVHLASKKGRK